MRKTAILLLIFCGLLLCGWQYTIPLSTGNRGATATKCGYSAASPPNQDGGNAAVPFATPCTTGSDANGYSVSTISIYNKDSVPVTWNLGVYANSASKPNGSPLCTTTITNGAAGQYDTQAITGCGTLSASTTYWIGENTANNDAPSTGQLSGNCTGFAFGSQFYSTPGVFTLPAPWGSSSDAGECQAMYITINPL